MIRRWFPWVCLAVWCATGVLLRSTPQATVLSVPAAFADFAIPFSGAWALASDLHIHTDFSTPLGLAYYLPYYWALNLFGNTANNVHHVQSALFVVFAVFSFLLLRPPRYRWPVTALGTAFISLFVANPGLFGWELAYIYEGVSYNYIGIATGYLCLLAGLFPAAGKWEKGSALIIGFCLAWVTFVKPNFLAQDVIFLAGAGVVGRFTHGQPRAAFFRLAAFSAVLLAVAFALVYRVNLIAMWRDTRMAAACRSEFVGRELYAHCQDILYQNWLALLVGGILFLSAAVAALLLKSFRRFAIYSALVAMVLAVDVFQSLFNAYENTLPMLDVIWLLMLGIASRGTSAGDPLVLWTRRSFYGMAVVVGLAHTIYTGAFHLKAYAYNKNPVVPVNVTAIDADGWDYLYFLTKTVSAQEFASDINSGLALIRSSHLEHQRIFALDQANYFPFLLRAPYPPGQPVWLHPEGTFSLKHHLPPEVIFAGADVLMIPHDQLNPVCPDLMMKIYGSYIGTNYTPVAANNRWHLAVRNVK